MVVAGEVHLRQLDVEVDRIATGAVCCAHIHLADDWRVFRVVRALASQVVVYHV